MSFLTSNQLLTLLHTKNWNTVLEDRVITGCICCDLHSHVLTHANAGYVWITVMRSINTAAVAYVKQLSCVILCDNQIPDEDLVHYAKQYQIPIASSPYSGFELCCQIDGILKKGY